MAIKSVRLSLMEQFQALPDHAQTLVCLLAVNQIPCRQAIMLACLKDLGVNDPVSGVPYNIRTIQPLQSDLVAKGLLEKGFQGVVCPRSVQVEVVIDCIMGGSFGRIALALGKHVDLYLRNPYRGDSFLDHDHLVRALRIALFGSGSVEEVYKVIEAWNRSFFRNTPQPASLMTSLFNSPFDPVLVEKIHPDIRLRILLILLQESWQRMEPLAGILNYIETNLAAELAGNDDGALEMIRINLFSGRTTRARALIAGLSDKFQSMRQSRLGWLEFICGNYAQARVLMGGSLEENRKLTRARLVYFENELGPLYLLALLEGNDPKELSLGLDYITIAEKKKFPLAPAMAYLRPVFNIRLGLPADKGVRPPLQAPNFRVPFFNLVAALGLFWSKPETAREAINYLVRNRDLVNKAGYSWLAAEFSALLAELDHDSMANAALADQFHAACGTVSCVNIIRKTSEWESTLNGLLSLIDPNRPATTKAGTKRQRLAWLFEHRSESESCTISPRMQQLGKNGVWTKGRTLALRNLHENHQTMEGLSDQDHLICAAISKEYLYSGWAHSTTYYHIEEGRVLPALIGHPLLFLENAPSTRVELRMVEPEIRIKENNGKLRLTLSPQSRDREFLVLRETPTRYQIVHFSEEQRRIATVLGKGITIPKEGEEKLRQVIEGLSVMVALQSDVEGVVNLPTVPADVRPHAHLLPVRDGLQMEVLVKPGGAGGSFFKPGRGGKNVVTEIDGRRMQAVRDLDEEKRRFAAVVSACPTLERIRPDDEIWRVDDPEEALELLLELKQLGDAVLLEWPQGEKMRVGSELSFSSLSLRINRDRDWFKATGDLRLDDEHSLNLAALLALLPRAVGRFIPLEEGVFLTITRRLRKRLDELAAYADPHGQGVRFDPLAALALEEFTDEVKDLRHDDAWKKQRERLAEVVRPPLPSTLQVSLRDYQKAGFLWLAQLSHWGVGGCLADDMGLGKTVQALAAILLRATQGPTLVVAPLSVTSNWLDEARRFAPTLKPISFGPGDRGETIAGLGPFDLLIVSYGLLPLEAERLASVAWQTVVLDEAQSIKNMQTKRSKAAMDLRAEFRLITTGTPVENHLGELWTLFRFLNPGLLGSLQRFNTRFAGPIERDQDPEARDRLRKLIRPFILRRLKSDVLAELPAKTEINLEVELSTEELHLYEAQRLKALENIAAYSDEGVGQRHLRILAEIMKLRRICCHPSLVMPDCGVSSSKLKVFGDTLDELLANKHKALVFSQFVDHLSILRDYLDGKGIAYQYLDGSTPIKQRQERITAFQSGEGEVFLISLKAGGSGLNLTAADYVIHMDPWWNPAVEDQASDRAHRIGQERPVTVYRLVVKGSIEEQIVALHREKRDLAESLLEGTDVAARISAQELLGLLRGEEGK